MNDQDNLFPPSSIVRIEAETKKLGFEMASEHQTGCLLRSLASAKLSANILELGTGTGLSAAWMLDGMDESSRLVSVDNDANAVGVAEAILGGDSRVEFHVQDGAVFLRSLDGQKFDLIFADTWPGKIWDLDLALSLLADGGIYIVDDMSHQPHWPKEHLPKIERLIKTLESKDEFFRTKLGWSTGIMLLTKKPRGGPKSDKPKNRKAIS